jgi:hypothetical protein
MNVTFRIAAYAKLRRTSTGSEWRLCFKHAPSESEFRAPARDPSGRALRSGLQHIKSRAEVQNPESGEKHRLGHADAPALQQGGRERPQIHESRVQIFTPPKNLARLSLGASAWIAANKGTTKRPPAQATLETNA